MHKNYNVNALPSLLPVMTPHLINHLLKSTTKTYTQLSTTTDHPYQHIHINVEKTKKLQQKETYITLEKEKHPPKLKTWLDTQTK